MWFLTRGISLEYVFMRIVAVILMVFFILPVHEFAHAWVAYKLGDDTAKNSGRLTFNPLLHFSPLGTLSLLLFNYGWANPVPIDSRNFAKPRRDMALTALAGPTSNLLIAILSAILYNNIVVKWFIGFGNIFKLMSIFFEFFILINVNIAVFNMLPVPPLDGFKIMESFIPDKYMVKYYQNYNYIVLIMFVLLFFGFFNGPIRLMEIILYSLIMKFTGG